MKTKAQKQLDHGWEVDWCEKVNVFDGSMDPDSAEYQSRDFATKAQADAFARAKTVVDVFGSVRVTEFRLEPLVPEYPWHKVKEYTSDTYYIDRE